MPYISKEDRERFEFQLTDLLNRWFEYPGHLNYVITSILLAYINNKGKSYQVFNDVIGVLECAKQELYRRMIAPYEDEKCKEAGDVF